MSIIIRLQNLPVSAKTGDIRKFFGGLQIPDGGVHILGGDKGDAFIAFMSDEDGRLAMRKDGGRIKDSRIKLFLSSRMEMQHEVEKITKDNFDTTFYEDITASTSSTRSKVYEKKRRSRSPHQYDTRNFDKSRPLNDYRRSKSPASYNTKKLSPVRYRSRSPRRRSRSPKLSSVKSKSFVSRRKSASPKKHDFHSFPADTDYSHFSQKNSGSQFLSPSDRQAELERRITEEIEKNALYKKALREEEESRFFELQQQHLALERGPKDLMYFSDNNTMHHLKDNEFKHDYAIRKGEMNNFYIFLEGMDPKFGFREVQIILKGHYAPQNNIKMEKDDTGLKTGRAIVKLTNKDDFDSILNKSVFLFRGNRIDAKTCPHYIAESYFKSNYDFKSDNYASQHRDLCYMLKGLPFTCKYEDVVAFFHGFETSEIIVFYGDDGQATGTGFVSFKNWRDFEAAFSQNGKKIGHRYIEMLPCTAKEMAEAKHAPPGGTFIPYSQILSEKRLPTFRRPICAILTGLPFKVTTKKILAFFSESGLKPDAIHLTLGKKRLSDGRAFVEFSNYLDFDLALKFHGKKLDDHTVCVKQILYDEMVKILDSQKAKHYFGTSAPVSTAVPEKVPYLWEPPDERHEKEVYGKDSRTTSPPNKNINSSFPPKDIPRRNVNPWYSQDIPKTDSLQPVYPNNSGYGTYDMRASKFDAMHSSVPYSNEFMSSMNDVYGPPTKYEENIRSSRLSPENEAALLDFLNRDRKPFSDRSSRRSRSLERRNKMYYKSRSKDSLRTKSEKETRHYESPLPDSLYFDVDEDIRKSECIVQLSNIDPSIGTRDLINFLKGFDFVEDTLIRRYTNNMPTSDVRVTFYDKSEAERAIRILNKRFLYGKPVNMFIV